MSCNVLVIPEDFRKDQYVLKPIVEKMMAEVGVKARVQVCADPLLGGVGAALKWTLLQGILDRYRGMVRLFLLIVDRDCELNRRAALDHLEARAHEHLATDQRTFLAEAAWQEIEVWPLAGMRDLPSDWVWREVRAECNPKEAYFTPYAKQRGIGQSPYGGRETLAREAATQYVRIRQLCPEDVGNLETRIRQALGG